MNTNATFSISVLSGKGGVGKTNVALNLAYCLYKGRHDLLLMDCDIGLANLDVLLGITPERNIQDLLDTDVSPEQVTVPLAEGKGFDFLPAASGVPELLELDEEMQATLFERLTPLFSRYHFLFMDLGAGITPTVLSFASMAKLRLVVVTPEPTSLTDSYAMIKVLATQHNVKDFHVVVNQVESKRDEQETFGRLNAACERFLGFQVQLLGSISYDKTISEAVRRQVPLMKHAPNSLAAKDIFQLALRLSKIREERRAILEKEPILNLPSGWDFGG